MFRKKKTTSYPINMIRSSIGRKNIPNVSGEKLEAILCNEMWYIFFMVNAYERKHKVNTIKGIT